MAKVKTGTRENEQQGKVRMARFMCPLGWATGPRHLVECDSGWFWEAMVEIYIEVGGL